MMGPGEKSFSDATAACEDMGAFLVEPRTEEINDAAKSFTFDVAIRIGLTDIEDEGQFVWRSDASHVTWTDWGDERPRNDDPKHDCVVIQRDIKAWNDISCEGKRKYLCQAYLGKIFILTLVF